MPESSTMTPTPQTESQRPSNAIGLANQLKDLLYDWTVACLAADELRRLDAVEKERDALMESLHDELDENFKLRDLGVAQKDEDMGTFLRRVIAERDQLRAEVQEQARLLGISAERELALRAQVERLQDGEAIGEVQLMTGAPGFTYCALDSRTVPVGTKLYTAHPAAPALVPLSAAKIKELQDDDVFFGTCTQIVRAIEQELGIGLPVGGEAPER